MTVHIAAVCEHEKQARIVLCSDWRSESSLGSSENTDKLRILPNDWVALMADTLSRAEELVAQYETHLGKMAEIRDDLQLFEEMKKPAQAHKLWLVESYVKQLLGISYADLLASTALPTEFMTKKLEEIERIKLGATLLIAGFCEVQGGDGEENEHRPYLFTVQDSDSHEDVVSVEDNFAAIGSGAYVATPVMHQRDHDSSNSLIETIYAVYEAKRLSEIVPGVGQFTSIDIMEPSGTMWSWTDELKDRCEWLFKKLGPRLQISDDRKKKLFAFQPDFFEPFDEADEPEDKSTAEGA